MNLSIWAMIAGRLLRCVMETIDRLTSSCSVLSQPHQKSASPVSHNLQLQTMIRAKVLACPSDGGFREVKGVCHSKLPLQAWIDDISSYIKGLDSNHLVMANSW